MNSDKFKPIRLHKLGEFKPSIKLMMKVRKKVQNLFARDKVLIQDHDKIVEFLNIKIDEQKRIEKNVH